MRDEHIVAPRMSPSKSDDFLRLCAIVTWELIDFERNEREYDPFIDINYYSGGKVRNVKNVYWKIANKEIIKRIIPKEKDSI